MTHVTMERGIGLTAPEPALARPARARLEVLEGLRFVAALGIVWFHMHAPGSDIASGALALFLALSSFFSVLMLEKAGPRAFWRARVFRVLLPWLVWCGFYLAVNSVRMDSVAVALRLENPWALLIGPSVHLWFLPFVFLSALPIWLIAPRIRHRQSLMLAAAISVSLSVWMLNYAESVSLPPFEQWTVALAPTIYGVLAAVALRIGAPLVAPVFIVLTVAGSLFVGATESLVPLTVGIVAFEIGRRVTWRAPILREFGRIAFGIYLIHPFFMFVLFKFGGESGTVASALVVFAASALASWVMVRVPVLRTLV